MQIQVLARPPGFRVLSGMASKASNTSPLASASQPPSSGDSAARQPSSNRVEQKMAASANLHEAPDIGPNHNYPSPTTSQVPQGSYYRAQPQDRFEAEDDMQMANALSHEMQHDVGTELVHAAGLSNGQGHIHDQDLTTSPSEAQQSGMAPPPQTPMQQQGPQHIGARNDGDQATGGESSRRKRSKVSRACDSCRRKKVGVTEISQTRPLLIVLFNRFAATPQPMMGP